MSCISFRSLLAFGPRSGVRWRRRTVSRLGVFSLLLVCAPAFATRTLTLMTYNIHAAIPMGHNYQTYTSTYDDLLRIGELITSSGADLVALQEVHCELGLRTPKRQPTSALNQPRVLAALTGHRYVFGSTLDDAPSWPANTGYLEWGTADRWHNNGASHGEFGNALLSRLPFAVPPENIPLPRKGQQEQRGCLRIVLQDLAVVVYATHLHHQDPPIRRVQMNEILRHARQESSGTTVFILGDLNAGPGGSDSPVVLAVRHGFFDLAAEGARARGEEPGNTFPADNPDGRIDYILCNRRLEVEAVKVIPSLLSDHRPVLVRVRLPEP